MGIIPLFGISIMSGMLEVTVFHDEDNVYQNEPTHEYIMQYLLHHTIRGASVFEAVLGYGKKHHLHRPRKLGGSDEESIMILCIDVDEKIR